ncbi:MAG: hypothetical protein COA63_012520 [Methylophaga sp.]|nr:hypothetical protein [Methylophaga sp.]
MKSLVKPTLVIILFFVGVVAAAPTEIDERVRYTSSLNVMASMLMNWYGSLIVKDQRIQFSPIDSKWIDYRSSYPENITHIKIISTDLKKITKANKYQFTINTRINSKDTEGAHSQLISETFNFHVPLLANPLIEKITREQSEEMAYLDISDYSRSHYKARHFAYAWLAYLDGVDDVKQVINSEQWMDVAEYSLKIGRDEIHGSIAFTLKERQKYLAKGGHLLGSVNVTEVDGKADHFILDLISEWKGINQEGKTVLAKVHQQIEIQIQENNEWKIISIKEEHLLPDIAPWSGFLC